MTVSYFESLKNQKLQSYSPEEVISDRRTSKMDKEVTIAQEGWKEIAGGNVFAFHQVGDLIEGVLIRRRTGQGQHDSTVYDIETKEGLRTVFGTAILDSRMVEVNDNQGVKIEYVGEIKTGTGRLAKNFKVFIKEI